MDIFSKIAAGEIPSYKCAETDEFYAFLDINPLVKGHTLCIPRREVDYIFDMDDDEIARFQVFAKHVAQAIKAVIPCVKVGEAVLGLEVPHAHIHLVPMQSEVICVSASQRLKLARKKCSLWLPRFLNSSAKTLNSTYLEREVNYSKGWWCNR